MPNGIYPAQGVDPRLLADIRNATKGQPMIKSGRDVRVLPGSQVRPNASVTTVPKSASAPQKQPSIFDKNMAIIEKLKEQTGGDLGAAMGFLPIGGVAGSGGGMSLLKKLSGIGTKSGKVGSAVDDLAKFLVEKMGVSKEVARGLARRKILQDAGHLTREGKVNAEGFYSASPAIRRELNHFLGNTMNRR